MRKLYVFVAVYLAVIAGGLLWVNHEVETAVFDYSVNGTVEASQFCKGGLTPEPEFCAKDRLKVVYEAHMQPFGVGAEDDVRGMDAIQPTYAPVVTVHGRIIQGSK